MKYLKYVLLCFILLFSFSSFAAKNLTSSDIIKLKSDSDWLDSLNAKIDAEYNTDEYLKYNKDYSEYIQSQKYHLSSLHLLAQHIQNSRLIMYGDVHTNPLSQENLIWVMNEVSRHKDKMAEKILVIEWVNKLNQDAIDAFLAGDISARTFKTRIDFVNSWGFSWKDHLAIIIKAKELGFKVLAAENKPRYYENISIKQRDLNIANSIKKQFYENKDSVILLSYGSSHLAASSQSHLKSLLASKNMHADCIIYPNESPSYWENLEKTKNLDAAKVFQISATEFYLDQAVVERKLSSIKYFARLSSKTKIYAEAKANLQYKAPKPKCSKI